MADASAQPLSIAPCCCCWVEEGCGGLVVAVVVVMVVVVVVVVDDSFVISRFRELLTMDGSAFICSHFKAWDTYD